jgi:dimethylaniline monooxygenase (N-oxide forming)
MAQTDPTTVSEMQQQVSLFSKRIAVVGGGVAGVTTARVFKSEKYDVTLFEAGPSLSGVWASGYPNFAIQTPGWLYEFPDKELPYPKDYKDGPSIQKYTEDYAQEHDLTKSIKLNTKVTSITRNPEGSKWCIKFVASSSRSSPTIEEFDFVALATGVYSPAHKFIPKVDGVGNFKGLIRHAEDTSYLKDRKGKKVLIVGFGKSAHDCSMNAWKESGVPPTLLFREAHWCVPRNVLGIIPMEYLLYNRFGQGTLPRWQECGPVELFFHTALYPLIWFYWRVVEFILILQLGLWGSCAHLRPKLAIENDIYAGHGVICHPEMFSLCHQKKIETMNGAIQCILPNGEIKLKSGQVVKADEIVFATGFQRTYDFFPQELVAKKEEDGFFAYRQMLVPRIPDIAFLNSNVTTFSNITTPALQARWLVEVIKGNIVLPNMDELESIVEKDKAWRRKHLAFAGAARGYLVQLQQIRYWDSLLRDMGANVQRKQSMFGPMVRSLKELFEPVHPADYKSIITGKWKCNSSEVRGLGYKPSFVMEWLSLCAFVAAVANCETVVSFMVESAGSTLFLNSYRV